jgi:hypothetical protein
MTPVIVPGLAANRIIGVSDGFLSKSSFERSWAGAGLARYMLNPSAGTYDLPDDSATARPIVGDANGAVNTSGM